MLKCREISWSYTVGSLAVTAPNINHVLDIAQEHNVSSYTLQRNRGIHKPVKVDDSPSMIAENGVSSSSLCKHEKGENIALLQKRNIIFPHDNSLIDRQ